MVRVQKCLETCCPLTQMSITTVLYNFKVHKNAHVVSCSLCNCQIKSFHYQFCFIYCETAKYKSCQYFRLYTVCTWHTVQQKYRKRLGTLRPRKLDCLFSIPTCSHALEGPLLHYSLQGFHQVGKNSCVQQTKIYLTVRWRKHFACLIFIIGSGEQIFFTVKFPSLLNLWCDQRHRYMYAFL